jgi:acetyl esterase/lipase
MRGILRDASAAEPAHGRAMLDRLAVPASLVPGVRTRSVQFDGLSATWFTPQGDRARSHRCVLFLHGGGYQLGSVRSYAQLIASLCRQADLPVFAIDYRLAPEHPYPAALDDALAAVRELRRLGFTNIGLCGDSAGGHLALSTALALRDGHLPPPTALALMCPWLDMATERPSRTGNLPFDVLPAGVGSVWARQFCGKQDPRSPEVSPINANLSGLPPCLVQVGERETLRDENYEFAERARQAGSAVSLTGYPEMVHDFHFFEALGVPEAKRAMRELGAFLRDTV